MAITLFDIATRPKAPPIEGVTEEQRRHGRRLALIHALYLDEIAAVENLIGQIDGAAADTPETRELGEALLDSRMIANYKQFGNFCGRQCQLLEIHHTIEDRHLFPMLRNRSEALDRVIDRLMEEHDVIHELIVTMHAQAVELVTSPGANAYQALKQSFETLAEIVRSHFGYEERELEAPLGAYGVPI